MMEAASTSETSVNFYQTTRRNNQEDNHLYTRRRENLKSHITKRWGSKKCIQNFRVKTLEREQLELSNGMGLILGLFNDIISTEEVEYRRIICENTYKCMAVSYRVKKGKKS
jgi:c-di-GMP-related signal transduction protein